MKDALFSIIIPVFNSEQIVADTVSQVVEVMREDHPKFEIVLINDASEDQSWEVLKELHQRYSEVKAIDLLKNYGQHSAVICGIRESSGDYLITMDDDLQNPPAEISKLISKIAEGYDLVFAKFREKKHSGFRKIGSKIIDYFNRKIFDKPDDITLTNFRIFNRVVADRVLRYRTNHPYIPGLLLMHAGKIGNVYTEHHERQIGKSNYSLWRILKLVSRLLFNYSSYPLKVISGFGLATAFISFFVGVYFLARAIFLETAVPGWTSIVVLLSIFNGVLILMLGVMGIYISRTLQQVSSQNPYHVSEILVGADKSD